MYISIRTPCSQSKAIKVHAQDTVLSLKQKINDREGIPPEQMKLLFAKPPIYGWRMICDEMIDDPKQLKYVEAQDIEEYDIVSKTPEMEDVRTLGSYGVTDGSQIHLVLTRIVKT
jgi:hypothetical protein